MNTNKTYNVLIFEDDITLANQWKFDLLKENFQVHHVWNLDEAVSLCNRITFDIIICDIFIQDYKGDQIPKAGIMLLSYLRISSLEKTPEWCRTVPIIVVSGSPKTLGFDALNLVYQMGGTLALRKPFTNAELIEKMKELLENNLLYNNS